LEDNSAGYDWPNQYTTKEKYQNPYKPKDSVEYQLFSKDIPTKPYFNLGGSRDYDRDAYRNDVYKQNFDSEPYKPEYALKKSLYDINGPNDDSDYLPSVLDISYPQKSRQDTDGKN
jgi:hypothetical protein